MISKQTAVDIALAYREIETAEALLEKITEDLRSSRQPDLRDAFGRPVGALELGLPSGNGALRLFQVPWSLAKPVIQAHIAAQKARISALEELARLELGVAPATTGVIVTAPADV